MYIVLRASGVPRSEVTRTAHYGGKTPLHTTRVIQPDIATAFLPSDWLMIYVMAQIVLYPRRAKRALQLFYSKL